LAQGLVLWKGLGLWRV